MPADKAFFFFFLTKLQSLHGKKIQIQQLQLRVARKVLVNGSQDN